MIENKDPLITVIVPIYNVENYLNRCLQSIVDQTYLNLEIILVNDGSTDSSKSIANKWAKKDQRIRLINQKNQGLSAARNKGIQEAKGEYLTFIDSDDFITTDYVSYLYHLLKNNNFQSSLAICSLMDVYSNSGKQKNMGNGEKLTLTGKQCLEKMCYHDLVDTCAYAKLGRRELYTDNFFPNGKLFEDIGSTYKLFEECSTVECGFEPKYYYVIRNNSIVTGKFNEKKLDLLEMTDQMAESVNKKFPDLRKATLRRQVYARFSTLNQTLGEKNVKRVQDDLIYYLKMHRKAIMQDKKAPRRDKIAYAMLLLGLPFYTFSLGMYLKLEK
jgi:glycosyltransferase involved in cell wall biosynthesis